MWSGWVVCDMYIAETCVYIWFDAWLCLVRHILMETDSCSIFKGEVIMDRHVGWDVRPSETAASGSGYGHTHVSVDIFVRL